MRSIVRILPLGRWRGSAALHLLAPPDFDIGGISSIKTHCPGLLKIGQTISLQDSISVFGGVWGRQPPGGTK